MYLALKLLNPPSYLKLAKKSFYMPSAVRSMMMTSLQMWRGSVRVAVVVMVIPNQV